ncbi:restriction endonuclease subunit S [Pseudomonas sp. C27(2019)]|uniref:restriction endonuclease subunit S n=1 Tax=Pseudomonas sp. C27(2019) TaxID=2604941 RepID=UPI001245E0D4|nr:restriction endonuclease subunit S [Pseudomonas sp. C27(2019)]QEY58133.1 restriction endonuclease subunit S [Pseudomonas sp. C27(2019)]
MSKVEQLITEHIDIWTSAILAKSTAGRGSSKRYELYGIKKLRELILELAVRGKLVPQDINDEPASVLLERIAAEKAKLIKEGKVKKSKPLPEVGEDEKPFELPQGWEWCRLQDVGYDWGQKKPDSSFTYIDVGSINKELGLIGEASVLNAEEAPSRARKLVKKGTVIYSTVRPYLLNIAVVDQEFVPEPIASTAFAIIHPLKGMCSSFIYRYLRSPSFVSYVESCQTGVAYPAINDKQFFMGLIPVPPANEQQRIVAKVDELMLLCDQLEQQTETSIDAHATLVEVLLATLTDSANANEMAQNWARVSEHFATLFTSEQSIEALKQTLLQLAVMGKLVPQDPDDEPAAVLLEKIAAEKAQLIKDKKIKPQKLLPPIAEEEQLFDLPPGWEWCRLDDICNGITSGSTPPKSFFSEDKGVPYLKVYNIKNQQIDFEYKSQFVEENYHASTLKRSLLIPGDVVMNIVGPPLGKIAIIPSTYPEWNCNQAIVIFRPIVSELNKYIYTYLISGMFLDKIELIGTAGQDNISVTKSRSILLPTPPILEQHRIVAKVDELMKICDQLKANLQQSQETQVQLTDALVDQALVQ